MQDYKRLDLSLQGIIIASTHFVISVLEFHITGGEDTVTILVLTYFFENYSDSCTISPFGFGQSSIFNSPEQRIFLSRS